MSSYKIAVELQNKRCVCQHDTGYDEGDGNNNSDIKCVARIHEYLIGLGVDRNTIEKCQADFERQVYHCLTKKWKIVQEIGKKIETTVINGGITLNASEIGQTIRSVDQQFYDDVKDYLEGC